MKHLEKNKKSKSIGSILINITLILSIVVLIFASYFVFSQKDSNSDTYIFGYKPFIISSGSMEPKYMTNSLVIIKKGGYENVQVGDVIAFKPHLLPDKIAFHRVIEITEDGFITKGDNNEVIDEELVTEENYVGAESFHTNFTAGIITELSKPFGFVKIIILPLIIIILFVVAIRLLSKDNKKKH